MHQQIPTYAAFRPQVRATGPEWQMQCEPVAFAHPLADADEYRTVLQVVSLDELLPAPRTDGGGERA